MSDDAILLDVNMPNVLTIGLMVLIWLVVIVTAATLAGSMVHRRGSKSDA